MVILVNFWMIREDHWLAAILASRPFRYIGSFSYGKYMLHMLAMHLNDVALKQTHLYGACVLLLSGGLLTIAVASVSYR